MGYNGKNWNDKILVFDGGMGSLLQGAGLKPGELPETWNIKHPEVLVKIHEDYLNAGAKYYFIEYIRREPSEIQ